MHRIRPGRLPVIFWVHFLRCVLPSWTLVPAVRPSIWSPGRRCPNHNPGPLKDPKNSHPPKMAPLLDWGTWVTIQVFHFWILYGAVR